MSYPCTHFSAATAAVADRFVASVAMGVKTYTLANAGAMPTAGARHITLCRTVVGGADTPGTIVVTGKDLSGATIHETMIPGATGVTVTGTQWFASVTSVVGPAGWVVDGGTDYDTIVVGCTAAAVVATGSGTLHSVSVNAKAAGTVTLADANGTIAILASNAAEGNYVYDTLWYGYLSVTSVAGADLTIIHSGTKPSSYSM